MKAKRRSLMVYNPNRSIKLSWSTFDRLMFLFWASSLIHFGMEIVLRIALVSLRNLSTSELT